MERLGNWVETPETFPNTGDRGVSYWGIAKQDAQVMANLTLMYLTTERDPYYEERTSFYFGGSVINSGLGLVVGPFGQRWSVDFYTMSGPKGSVPIVVVRPRDINERTASAMSKYMKMLDDVLEYIPDSGGDGLGWKASSSAKKAAAASSGGCLLPMMGIAAALVAPIVGASLLLLS